VTVRHRRAVPVLAVALGLLATVTGCATKGTAYATPTSGSASATAAATAPAAPSASASAAPTASMTPLAAATGQLTGTQLATVLLPAADFPSGFALSSSGATTSGGSLTSAAASYPLATVSCSDFVQHLGSTGFGETAMAADSVVGPGQAFDQVIYQFSSASAATAFVAGIEPLAARCTSFTAPADGTTVPFSLTAAPGGTLAGLPTVDLRQTGTVSGSSVTLDTLFAASGVDVFAASAVGLGASAPTVPTRPTIIYQLMKRQAAAAVLS
jgi:hypothetical protein